MLNKICLLENKLLTLRSNWEQNYFKKMDLYQKIKEQRKSPFKAIAEKAGVTEKYVRQILSGKRNGTKYRNAKGKQIIELAEQLIQE